MLQKSFIFVTLFFFFLFPLFAQQEKINPQDITIIRDQYGVPHIYAQTDAQAAYGLIWAQAEDDFDNIQLTYCAVRGKAGSVFGKEGAGFDLMNFLCDFDRMIPDNYLNNFSPQFKKVLAGHVQGINDYASAHPEELKIKKGIFPISEKDVIKGYMFGNMVVSNAVFDVAKLLTNKMAEEVQALAMSGGSNAWAFNSKKTANGKSWLISNSHQPFNGPFSWHEAHVHSEEGWHMMGANFSTGVSLFLGCNENLAWTHTVNYPDMCDSYLLKMHPKKKLQYEFDGEWLELEKRKIKIKVKVGPIRVPISKTFYWSKYGPTVKTKHGMIAVRFQSMFTYNSLEQWFWMNKAKDLSEFKKAMEMQGLSSLNTVYADKDDNIFMVSNSLQPNRNPKYEWKKLLPGSSSETLWKPKFAPFKDLPMYENPSSGVLFNMNNTPFSATASSENLSASDFPKTMGYGILENNRSLRFLELFEGIDKLSMEEFKTIKYNQQYCSTTFYAPTVQDLDQFMHLDPQKYPDIKDVILLGQSWNRSTDIENKQAAIFSVVLYYLLQDIIDDLLMLDLNTISEAQLVAALRKTKKHLKRHFGSIEIPLGDLQKHVRGKKEFPIGGMPDVLAAMTFEKHKKGRLKAFHGESFIQFVEFNAEGVSKIESVVPYGSSNKKDSPHYDDQIELYLKQELKPMTMNKAEVFKNAKMKYYPGEVLYKGV